MSEPGPVTLHDHLRDVGGPLVEDLTLLLTRLAVAGRIIARASLSLYPLYPADAGKADGRLRLQAEAAPMAFIAEQAGGRASTGRERSMTIPPATPHQRVPLLIGSAEDVAPAEDFSAGRQ